jgi:hypothetical protein
MPPIELAQEQDVIWHWIGQDQVPLPVGDDADLLTALVEA